MAKIALLQMGGRVKDYLSLVKFSHTVFAMPFALMGFFWAIKGGTADVGPGLLLLVVLCMVFARNAAMGFNRLVDARFDAKNPRTSRREIPRGTITPRASGYFVLANSLLFMAATYLINPLVLLLSPVALFVILFYSYTKRFTWLCHFVLGLGLSLAPIGAYLAVVGRFSPLPLLYSAIVLCWVSGFDIIYSLQDEGFDRMENLKSLPVRFGAAVALRMATALHVVAGGIVVFVGARYGFSAWYWVGALVFIGMLVYQHLIVSPGDLSRVDMAFATTNGVASVIFATFAILSYWV